MPTTALEQLLAKLPDNDQGLIDAVDLREVVTALWYKSAIGGEVDGDGVFVKGPPGWTAERLEAGKYRITHNLGTLDYAVSLTTLSKTETVGIIPAIESTSENDFVYMTWHSGTSALHAVWTQFVVAVN